MKKKLIQLEETKLERPAAAAGAASASNFEADQIHQLISVSIVGFLI